MYRSPLRNRPRRAPARTAPQRTSTNGRLARPGRPPRRSGPNRAPILGLVLLAIALAAGALVFWQADRTRAAAEIAAAATPQPTSAPAESPTPLPTLTPTPPIIASGSVPGGPATVEPAQAGTTATASVATDEAVEAAVTPRAGSGAIATAESPERPRPTTTPASAGAPTPENGDGPDFVALQERMLERVNADRVANGLEPVAWDETAALAGQLHAEEMAEFGYMSHWNMAGYGPEYRYNRAGGLDVAQENVYRLVYTWQGPEGARGRGAPIEDWEKVIADAQEALMDSPGHRANILAPEHTHLGVGIAYNAAAGNLAIAQEFVNQYVALEPLPRRGQPGDRIVLRGSLLSGTSDPLVNIAFEPFPEPLSLEELNKTSTYTPAAEHLSVPQVVAGNDGRFVSEYTLPRDAAPGLYHVLVWVRAEGFDERVMAADAIIEVSG